MKLLVEQRTYLEEKITKLQREFERITENKNLNPISTGSERQIEQLEIKKKSDELNWYQKVLATSSLITSFDNDRIDLGTTFQIKLENDEKVYSFTMVETILDGYFGPNHGYITKESPLGKEIYQKEGNQDFYLQIEGEDIKGTIIGITQKENIQNESMQKEKRQPAEEVQKKKRSQKNKACDKYKEYVKKLRTYEKFSEISKKEILHLQMITISQHKELKTYYEKFLKTEKNKAKCSQTFGRDVGVMKRDLARSIITSPNPTYIDLGTKMILEIDIEGEKTVTKLELVPSYYLRESMNSYLSVKTTPGFTLYKAQIGDRMHFQKRGSFKARDIVVAQFGIDEEKLLLPTSSNLTHYNQKQRMESNFRKRYQKDHSVVMTQSQKELLDQELSKISSESQKTPYIKTLQMLKIKVENNKDFVQTEQMLQENKEYVGIGSTVNYAILTEDNLQQQEKELISCAFTTEQSDQYIEEFTPLGKSLLGRKKEDCFEVEIDGEIKKGIILDVTNTKVENNEKVLNKQ